MTSRGKIFAQIISIVCWTKGWGTTGTTRQFPDINPEEGKDLQWLVDNGYLFHYRTTVSQSRGRYGQYGRRYSEADLYGLTKKGWAVAEQFVRAAEAEDPDYKIEYQYPEYPRRPQA